MEEPREIGASSREITAELREKAPRLRETRASPREITLRSREITLFHAIAAPAPGDLPQLTCLRTKKLTPLYPHSPKIPLIISHTFRCIFSGCHNFFGDAGDFVIRHALEGADNGDGANDFSGVVMDWSSH